MRDDVFDRIVREGMEKLGWSRERAEKVARDIAKRIHARSAGTSRKATASKPASAAKSAKRRSKKRKALARVAVAQPITRPNVPKKPLTALHRLLRAEAGDDGKRRGRRPFVQGGSPGLGKR